MVNRRSRHPETAASKVEALEPRRVRSQARFRTFCRRRHALTADGRL